MQFKLSVNGESLIFFLYSNDAMLLILFKFYLTIHLLFIAKSARVAGKYEILDGLLRSTADGELVVLHVEIDMGQTRIRLGNV